MARRIKAKLVVQLRERSVPGRQTTRARHVSAESACEVFDQADERDVTWQLLEPMADGEAYRLFYPDKHVRETVFEELDWAYVHEEMSNAGVNLRLLHDEYRDECRRTGKVAVGYTRSCGDYGKYTAANGLTRCIEHKVGRSCEVNWSGPAIGKGLVDPTTGEASKVYLFVGVLPFGQGACFEPTLDMRERTRPRCHVHMCECWGGVPEGTVCDNLTAGVVSGTHARARPS
jgi:transposase